MQSFLSTKSKIIFLNKQDIWSISACHLHPRDQSVLMFEVAMNFRNEAGCILAGFFNVKKNVNILKFRSKNGILVKIYFKEKKWYLKSVLTDV